MPPYVNIMGKDNDYIHSSSKTKFEGLEKTLRFNFEGNKQQHWLY